MREILALGMCILSAIGMVAIWSRWEPGGTLGPIEMMITCYVIGLLTALIVVAIIAGRREE